MAEELQEKLTVNKATCQCSLESTKRELESLRQRVEAACTLFRYLKIQAKASANLNTACAFFRIKHQEGIGFVDSHGVPLSKWSKNADISEFESPAEEAAEANDNWFAADIFSLVRMVTCVTEYLVKRVLMAETEASVQKEKASLANEMTLAVERVTTKIDEIVKSALDAIPELAEQFNSFKQEAAMQRERANEHEQEAAMQRTRATAYAQENFLLKQKVAAVKSDVQLVIRRTVVFLSSQEKIMEKLIFKVFQLHDEKVSEKDKVQKLLNENVRLNSLVDQKEAQLVALNEQLRLASLSKCDK